MLIGKQASKRQDGGLSPPARAARRPDGKARRRGVVRCRMVDNLNVMMRDAVLCSGDMEDVEDEQFGGREGMFIGGRCGEDT